MRALIERIYREVANADVPAEFGLVAFRVVLEHQLRGSTAPADSVGASGRADLGWVAQATAKLRLENSLLESVFDIDASEPQLIVSRSRIPGNRAAATRSIALLVAAVRQAGGVDAGWTAISIVRDVCRDYGVLDQANFAAHIGAMDGIALRGSGAAREIKVTMPGLEAAARQIEAFAR